MDIQIFVQNVKQLLDERGISYSRAGRESGAGEDFIRNIDRKSSFPSIDKVKRMADYLGVTVSDLLGEEKPTPVDEDGQGKSDNVVRIAGRDGSFYERKISDTQRELLVQILDNFKSVDDENV